MLARTRLASERTLSRSTVLGAPRPRAVLPARGIRQHLKAIKKRALQDLKGRLTGRIEVPEPLQGPVIKPEPPKLSSPVINVNREVIGQVTLHNEVWDQEIRKDLVKRVIDWQLAKRIFLGHHEKSRAEVSGSGKKPHPQKGTGRARQGTRRAPHHKGGGHAFPRKHRTLEYSLQKKVRLRALKIALSAKLKEGNLVIIDKLVSPTPDKKAMLPLLKPYRVDTHSRVLIIHGNDEEVDPNFILATRGLQWVDLLPERGANVYDIVNHTTLFVTLKGLAELEQTLTLPRTKITYVAPDMRFPDGYTLDEASQPRPPVFSPADGSAPVEITPPPLVLRSWRNLSSTKKLSIIRAQLVKEILAKHDAEKARQAEQQAEGEQQQQQEVALPEAPLFTGKERLPPRVTIDLADTKVQVDVKDLAHAIIGRAKRAPSVLPTLLPEGLARRMKKLHNFRKKQEKLRKLQEAAAAAEGEASSEKVSAAV